MSNETPRLRLPLLAPGQAHKEVVHNEALGLLDALVGLEIAGQAAAPTDGPAGEALLVADTAAGVWLQHRGKIAIRGEGGWAFVSPVAGCIAWDRSAGSPMIFNGQNWMSEAWPVKSLEVEGKRVVAHRQPAISEPVGGATIDAESRASIAAILSIMRAHGLIEM